ncbi:MAG TPA: GNAT family N-acetyltransferase [Candidatus Polarisedimenticolia bacterium]|nr:GNAT family N-acetyltransferase [Candidatus Polarisedimenticolia bacterium]
MDPIYVSAGPGDAAIILDMMREYYPIEGAAFCPDVQGPALRALLADPALGRVYLVRQDEAIAGYVVLTFDYGLEAGGREMFIDELFIVERCRGLGLGTRVLEFVSGASRDLGGRALHLAVGFDNRRAREVYERHGFASTQREMMTLVLVDS